MSELGGYFERTIHGAGSKYRRAVEHLDALDIELQWFNEGGPCQFAAKFDNETGEHYFVIDRLHPIPVRWSAIVGDCVQNFRNALDHVITDISGLRGGDTLRTAFPICSKPDLFKKSATDGRLGASPPGARTIIENLQPYQPRDDLAYDPRVFWALHELSNIDKHRAILLFAQVATGATFQVGSASIDFAQKLPQGSLGEGAEVARISATELHELNPEARMNMSFSVPLSIGFADIPPSDASRELGLVLNGKSVYEFLFEIGLAVQTAVNRLLPYIADPRLD